MSSLRTVIALDLGDRRSTVERLNRLSGTHRPDGRIARLGTGPTEILRLVEVPGLPARLDLVRLGVVKVLGAVEVLGVVEALGVVEQVVDDHLLLFLGEVPRCFRQLVGGVAGELPLGVLVAPGRTQRSSTSLCDARREHARGGPHDGGRERSHRGLGLLQVQPRPADHHRELHLCVRREVCRTGVLRDDECTLRTSQTSFAVRHDRQVLRRTVQPTYRTQLPQRLSVPSRPIRRQSGGLANHVHPATTPHRRLGVLVGELRVHVEQPPHHHQVTADALSAVLAQRPETPAHVTIELAEGDVLGDLGVGHAFGDLGGRRPTCMGVRVRTLRPRLTTCEPFGAWSLGAAGTRGTLAAGTSVAHGTTSTAALPCTAAPRCSAGRVPMRTTIARRRPTRSGSCCPAARAVLRCPSRRRAERTPAVGRPLLAPALCASRRPSCVRPRALRVPSRPLGPSRTTTT